MSHLLKISQFLYFQLVSIFLLLLYLYNTYSWSDISSFVYVYFTLLLIPLVDTLLSGVFSGMRKIKILNKKNIIGFISYVFVNILLLIFWYFTILLFLCISVIYTCIYKIDGRLYFISALLVFLYVMVWLIIWDSTFAEGLSILAYYLLIAWVVSQVYENISLPKSSSHA